MKPRTLPAMSFLRLIPVCAALVLSGCGSSASRHGGAAYDPAYTPAPAYGAAPAYAPSYPQAGARSYAPAYAPSYAAAQPRVGGFGGNRYDPNSLANPYGAGSRYRADGLMNPYS